MSITAFVLFLIIVFDIYKKLICKGNSFFEKVTTQAGSFKLENKSKIHQSG